MLTSRQLPLPVVPLALRGGYRHATRGDLDRESADSILQLLNTLAKDHSKTIVMVTHDPKAADAAHRTLHLEKGQLIEQNRPTL